VLPPNPTTAPRGGGVWREDVALERIATLLGGASSRVAPLGWGDDAAVFDRPGGRVLLCTDAAVAGIHLDVEQFPIEDLGYRAAIATLSDLAAMGASPLGVVVAICAPGDVDVIEIEAAVVAACAAHGCTVAGGDLSRSATPTVTVAALGEERAGRTVTRAGASAGDVVFVTGPLGGAAAGLRRRREGASLHDATVLCHRRPVARIAEGEAAARSGATAMIDVSDGIARDLRRVAAASGVGVELDDVPVRRGATMDEALGGGEDYELVVTHPEPEQLEADFAAAGLRAPLRVGTVVSDPSALTIRGDRLPDIGWRH